MSKYHVPTNLLTGDNLIWRSPRSLHCLPVTTNW